MRKELQTVKQRAVTKIKSLQSQVDALQAQLQELSPPVAPPESSSEEGSEKSSGSGFMKIESPSAASAAHQQRERELEAREAAILQQEQELEARLAAVAMAESASGPAEVAWQGALLAGLLEINGNLARVGIPGVKA